MSRHYRRYWESYRAPGLLTCPHCGAVIGDTEEHDTWHHKLEERHDREVGEYVDLDPTSDGT